MFYKKSDCKLAVVNGYTSSAESMHLGIRGLESFTQKRARHSPEQAEARETESVPGGVQARVSGRVV